MTDHSLFCRHHLPVALALVALTLLGYFWFPGHTYLQSDSQIYVPMLEHFWNPAVLQKDFMVQRPHMAFTLYDEVAIAVRRWTGLGFREILSWEQLLFRFAGLVGVYLLARAFHLPPALSLLVPAIFGLGAFIGGPTVLTVEYEPVPRAFALPLVFLAIGLVAHGRDLAAGTAASLGFLIHPTTTLPFWAVYFCLSVWPGGGARAMQRRVLGLFPLLVAVVLLLVASRIQVGVTEPPEFLSRIPQWWEQVLRMRSPYLWVSLWQRQWFWHYSLLFVVASLCFWGLRKETPSDLRFFLAGLPLLGAVSLPVSWLLLEHLKLALAPQLQPARTVLYITAGAQLMCCIYALGMVTRNPGRCWLAAGLLAVCLALPCGDPVHWTLGFNFGRPFFFRRLSLVLALAAVLVLAARLGRARPAWQHGTWLAALLLPYLLLPTVGKVQNYPELWTPEIRDLAQWASSKTPLEATFLFADAGRDLSPGIFRATALRAIYVDWKGGGQANYLRSIAAQWQRRWQQVDGLRFKGGTLAKYSELGVDFVVLRSSTPVAQSLPVYFNGAYKVYKLR